MSRRTRPYLLHASLRPDAQVDHEAYPFGIAAVRDLADIGFHPNVTFFVGENSEVSFRGHGAFQHPPATS